MAQEELVAKIVLTEKNLKALEVLQLFLTFREVGPLRAATISQDPDARWVKIKALLGAEEKTNWVFRVCMNSERHLYPARKRRWFVVAIEEFPDQKEKKVWEVLRMGEEKPYFRPIAADFEKIREIANRMTLKITSP